MTCPLCNNTRGNKRYDADKISLADVWRCKKCGAVFGSCYLGDSYTVVKPHFHGEPKVDPSATFYYDLTTVGSNGVGRRHGWAHKETRRIVQVG